MASDLVLLPVCLQPKGNPAVALACRLNEDCPCEQRFSG